MSNPHEREWASESDENEGVTIVLDGPAQAVAVEMCWTEIEENAAEVDYIERSALRIRHGARAACKRLRGERDEALDILADGVRIAQRLARQRDRFRALARRLIAGRYEARASAEYFSGYEADLACIDRVLNDHDAPHDCEDGVSLAPKRIRLLAEERDAARRNLAALEWLVKPPPASVLGTWGWDPATGAIWTYCVGGLYYHATYAEAARELGWEG